MTRTLLLFLFVMFFSGCISEKREDETLKKCESCHKLQLDPNHLQSCSSCHKGESPAKDRKSAHLNLVKSPAHPDHMVQSCGSCHGEVTGHLLYTSHFTLRNLTNTFRKTFGAKVDLDSFLDTPVNNLPESGLELADDLLRRRCFRCHPYNHGDNYPSVAHGTGCASCHLHFTSGDLQSHSFQKPGDEQCLSCHYGNNVGFDYYGRFEHDLNVEYRTPYTTANEYFRPYGVEYHQLQPDIHQQRGMLCIDCHSGRDLMGQSKDKPSCKDCHQIENLRISLPPQIEKRQSQFILKGQTGQDHVVPLLKHPAHFEQQEDMSCQVCHAQWTFNDARKHYLRSDTDDFDSWYNLSVQGSFEIETIVENNNDFDKTELPPIMYDKITGESKTGLWYKGFTTRRWETVILGRDENGAISTMRPMLDYSLSWIDEDENVRFDSIQPQRNDTGLLPYVPHTTGPAGLFYSQRIHDFLTNEKTETRN